MLLSAFNFRLGEKYTIIAEKALEVPKDTIELMNLIKYVSEVEEVHLVKMEEELREMTKCINFLVDHTTMTPGEIKQNTFTFNA